jgi:hypothetical protein
MPDGKAGLAFPEQFRPVLTYVMKHGRPDQVSEVLDEDLWLSRGVVYARMYQGNPVYIGSTDRRLRGRILSHLNHIHEYAASRDAVGSTGLRPPLD